MGIGAGDSILEDDPIEDSQLEACATVVIVLTCSAVTGLAGEIGGPEHAGPLSCLRNVVDWRPFLELASARFLGIKSEAISSGTMQGKQETSASSTDN